MAQRRERGRKAKRYHKGKPHRQGPRRDTSRTRRDDRKPAKREMLAKGRAGEVGLDGKLRVELEPLKIDLAARLGRGKGAQVFTPRGDGLGRVDSIIGTLDRPLAVVKVYPDARKAASEVHGRELFLG
jgi:hypothetical protein